MFPGKYRENSVNFPVPKVSLTKKTHQQKQQHHERFAEGSRAAQGSATRWVSPWVFLERTTCLGGGFYFFCGSVKKQPQKKFIKKWCQVGSDCIFFGKLKKTRSFFLFDLKSSIDV